MPPPPPGPSVPEFPITPVQSTPTAAPAITPFERKPEPYQDLQWAPVSAPAPAPEHVNPQAIPDFSDEDMLMLEELARPRARQDIELEVVAPPRSAPPKLDLKKVEPEPVREEPQPEPEPEPEPPKPQPLPEVPQQPVLPMQKKPTLVPTKFLSSEIYATILGDSRGIRRSLRQSDEGLKDTVSRHDQLDQLLKRAANDINLIQENLIRIDTELFEEV
jgi:hypothetical protein